MTTYYNEHDPYAAQWLRNLILEGVIPAGEVDERSIVDVRENDLRGFRQCHFFAGIGGWAYAIRLAGWSDDSPIWTGSCPCQPFSAAGQGAGFDDERHLWPAFYDLIRQCAPPIVVGEQVASPAALEWLDVVSADLEAAGYAFGAVDLSAAGVGAPHIRQRLFWVADGHDWGRKSAGLSIRPTRQEQASVVKQWSSQTDTRTGATDGFWRDADWLLCRDGKWRPVEPGTCPLVDGIPADLGWDRAGKATPHPQAAPSRFGMLRGYGNSIVPELAATFLRAVANG